MFRTTLGAAAALGLLLGTLSPAQPGMVVGIFDSTRAATANILTGSYTHEAVASLEAHFPGTTFSSTPTLTPAFLSGIDVLLIGSERDDSVGMTPLSASEQTAMLDFIKGGGRALLVAEGYSPYVPAAQSMVSPFGMTVVDDGLTGVLTCTVTAPAHPIINGPFGVTSSMLVYGSGIFTNLGPYAQSLIRMDGNNQSVLAVIENHALSPTSGRVVFMADSSPLIDGALGGFFPSQEALFLNTMQYLSVPEPSAMLMATMAGGALVLVGLPRLARRR